MGAHSVEHTTTDPNETLEEAFSRLCDEVAYMDGHSGYSGEINTCTGIHLATSKLMTLDEAQRFADQRLEHMHKREDAEGVPLATETPAQYGETTHHTSKPIRLTGAAMRRVLDGGNEALRAEVARSLKIALESIRTMTPVGNTFASVRVTRWATKTQATQGKAMTRYFIDEPNARMMPEWKSGYDTQAQARAALKTALDSGRLHSSWSTITDVEASIISMTRREDGGDLVTGTATPKEIEIVAMKVAVAKVIKPATVDRTKRSGWYIYGMAAS